MRSYFVKLLVIYVSLSVTLLFFQNCSPKFKTVDDGLASSDSILSAPDVTFNGASEMVTELNPNFSFVITGSATSVTCSLNGAASTDCSSGSVTFNNLADGDYTLDVTATSTAGANTRRHLFRKDSTAPVINVTLAPPSSTSVTSVTFVFSVTDNLSGVASIQCSLNNAAFSNCTSPMNLSNLAISAYNFRMQTRDNAGNSSALYSYNWTVVAPAAPSVSLSMAPASLSNLTNASFTFSGMNAASYECSADSAAFSTCTSPHALQNVAAGVHIFRVRAVSSGGVRSSDAQASWTVDLTPPSAPSPTTNVQSSTNQTAATFNFSSTDSNGIARYECSLDNVAFAACVSPRVISNLTAGSHNFRVRAVDNAGNISQIGQLTWTIDLTNPTLAFTQTPAASSTATTANFAFNSSDAGSGINLLQCSLDNATFANCTSPVNLSGLAVSSHNFRVQARDNAGNMTVISHSWVVTANNPTPPGNSQIVAGTLRWRSGFENGVPGEWLNYIQNFFANGNISGALGWTLVNTGNGEPVFSGNYAYKGSVLSFSGAGGGVRRAYPVINSDIPTPLINTFMIYVDVNYNVMGSGDWISIATYANHPDRINWPDLHGLSIVNRRLEMAHMESPGFSGQYVGPMPQPEFPTRRWVRITTYIHYEPNGRGRVDVWQDGVRVYTGIQQNISTNTTMTVGHWGLYTNDANWQAHLYNDDMSIWSLSQPLTDFTREPVVQP